MKELSLTLKDGDITNINIIMKRDFEKEKKTKRFNFMMKPSVYEGFCIIADSNNISTGSLMNLLITDYLRRCIK